MKHFSENGPESIRCTKQINYYWIYMKDIVRNCINTYEICQNSKKKLLPFNFNRDSFKNIWNSIYRCGYLRLLRFKFLRHRRNPSQIKADVACEVQFFRNSIKFSCHFSRRSNMPCPKIGGNSVAESKYQNNKDHVFRFRTFGLKSIMAVKCKLHMNKIPKKIKQATN